jgi:putative FmdB family regulatory protein
MPTYEYECQKCSHRFEAFQGINDPSLSQCPLCKGKVRRLISPGAGLIFKGSGFYITDYKKKEISKPSPKTDKPASGSGEKQKNKGKTDKADIKGKSSKE